MSMDTTVRARMDGDTKRQATAVLDRMGLNASDLIRITFRRVAEEERIPFAIEVPNSTTRAALDELDAGGGQHFATVAELMGDIGE